MFTPEERALISNPAVVVFLGDGEPKTTKEFGKETFDVTPDDVEEDFYSCGGICAQLEVFVLLQNLS